MIQGIEQFGTNVKSVKNISQPGNKAATSNQLEELQALVDTKKKPNRSLTNDQQQLNYLQQIIHENLDQITQDGSIQAMVTLLLNPPIHIYKNLS